MAYSTWVVVAVVSIWLAVASAQADTISFNVTQDSPTPDFLTVREGQVFSLNITITDGVESGIISVVAMDGDVFDVVNATEYNVTQEGGLPFTFVVHVRGKFIGISGLEIRVKQSADMTPEMRGEYTIKVIRTPTILDLLFTYLLLVWLVISYITTGAKMQPKIIWSKMKPPWPILIGMLGQFVIMPLWAFALTKIFSLDAETALGVIFVGTCPGGWLSNIFSLLLDCDFVLSLTMTFCSTVMAMGLMPLNLFIYATPIIADNAELVTPFVELAIQLLTLVVPIGLGMALCYKFEKFKKVCEKLLKPLAAVLIVLALGLGIPSQLYIFSSPWQVWVVSTILPIGGVLLGAVLAKLVCLPKKVVITVALETGAQNALLAKTMLDLFYPRPEADLVGRVPLMTSLIGLVEGGVVIIIYILINYVICRKEEDEDDLIEKEAQEKGIDEAEKTDIKEVEDKGAPNNNPIDHTHVNPVFDKE